MGLFSFLGKKKDPVDDAIDRFLKTQEAGIFHSNLKFYMGYDLSDMNDEDIRKKVSSAFYELITNAILYRMQPILQSQAAISINKLLTSICRCDYKLARQFENEFFTFFGIDGIHRFGLGG